MKPGLSLKNIYRSLVRSIFIFILLASTTCLLFSNIMEFYVSKRETEKAIETFDGIGTLERRELSLYAENMEYGEYILTDPRVSLDFYPEERTEIYRGKMSYDRLSNSDIERIEEMECVTYTDKRYMTSGVSDTYTRLDMNSDYYYDFTSCYVIEATVEKWYENQGKLLVDDVEFIGGTRHVNFLYDKMWIEPEITAPEDVEDEWLALGARGHYSDKGRYTVPWCKALKEGDRYVFIFATSENQYTAYSSERDIVSLYTPPGVTVNVSSSIVPDTTFPSSGTFQRVISILELSLLVAEIFISLSVTLIFVISSVSVLTAKNCSIF